MKNKLIIFASIALILLGTFYWFQYRPTQIKEDCSTVRKNQADILDNKIQSEDLNLSMAQLNYLEKRLDTNYETCLHSKGL